MLFEEKKATPPMCRVEPQLFALQMLCMNHFLCRKKVLQEVAWVDVFSSKLQNLQSGIPPVQHEQFPVR